MTPLRAQKYNLHTHTHFCDGTSKPEAYIEAALALGLETIGFSGHSPVPWDSIWNMSQEKFQAYLNCLKKLQAQYHKDIEIRIGLECDFIPEICGSKMYETHVDYTIGSVHYVGFFADGSAFGIDSSPESFAHGLAILFEGNIQKCVKAYFERIQAMIMTDPPTIIGHLDLIKKWNQDSCYFCEDDAWYHKIILETLDIIAASNCILEINTSGFVKSLTKESYPSPWIIEAAQKRNIPLILSSDAHDPSELIRGFDRFY